MELGEGEVKGGRIRWAGEWGRAFCSGNSRCKGIETIQPLGGVAAGWGLTRAILGPWSKGSLGSCPVEEKAVCSMGGGLSVIWLSVLWEKGCS